MSRGLLVGTILVLGTAAWGVAQSDAIHPLFANPTPDGMRQLYANGRKDAARKLDLRAIMDAYRKDLGKVRSPSGESWPASSATFYPGYLAWWYKGFQDARTYHKPDDFEAQIADCERNPGKWHVDTLRMSVAMRAWPGLDYLGRSVTRSAREADVHNVAFALLVDGDRERAILPVAPPEMVSASSQEGGLATARDHVATVNTQSRATASAYGSGGYAWGSAYGTATSTVHYTTTEVEGYNAYFSDWDLAFPLYTPDGKPTIPAGTKTLVLKVIRDNGELSTVFKLSDYMR